jgi:hypothetical protein
LKLEECVTTSEEAVASDAAKERSDDAKKPKLARSSSSNDGGQSKGIPVELNPSPALREFIGVPIVCVLSQSFPKTTSCNVLPCVFTHID